MLFTWMLIFDTLEKHLEMYNTDYNKGQVFPKQSLCKLYISF